jgi:hypothetical protein
MARLRFASAGLFLMPLLLVAGCASTTPNLLVRSEGVPPQHDFQSRQLETADEERVLAVCTALLQDMGFQVDEAAAALGVLSASKLRDANRLTPRERIAVTVVSWGLLAGIYTAPLALFLMGADSAKPVNIDVGITTRKTSRNRGQVSVTVVFKENATSINDPLVYQEFFDQLSKALFLEARES